MTTQYKTIEIQSPITGLGNADLFVFKASSATGVILGTPTLAELLDANNSNAPTGNYTATIAWDDTTASNEPLGQWYANLGSSAGVYGGSSALFVSGQDDYRLVGESASAGDIAAIKAKTDQLVFTVANQVDSNALSGGSLIGSGAIEYPINITSAGSPVDGAEVWVTTDEAGDNVIAGTLSTNAMGDTPNFMLDAGTYYVWVQKSGVNFTNPTEIMVS